MKREFAVLGMVICLVVGGLAGWLIPTFLGGQSRASLLDEIKARGKIVIGTSSDWPPFEIYNVTTDQYEGFDIDLCGLIANEINVTIEWSDMSFAALIDSCLAGTIDMIAAAMFATPARVEQLAFSMGYIRTNMVMVVLENSTITVSDYNDLLGLEVDVLSGTAEMWELDDAGISYNDYPKADVMATNLVANFSQVAFVDEPVFNIWSKIYDFKVIFTVLAEPCSLFCRWDEPELMAVINKVLLESYTDGTLDALIDKWFT
ncbi:MAG: transporter substrate-binding domain-containing protein [Candidatus Thorarchaeota archaeon]